MLNSSGEPLTLSGFFVGRDTRGPGSSSASSGNANPNPLTSQTGVGSIGSSIGAPADRSLRCALAELIRRWHPKLVIFRSPN